MQPMFPERAGCALWMAIAGVGYAILIGWCILDLLGGGHGWNTLGLAQFFALILCPAIGIDIPFRKSRFGRILLGMARGVAVVADVAWVYFTARTEGWEFVHDRVVVGHREHLLVPVSVWFLPQAVAAAVLLLGWRDRYMKTRRAA